jgi:hypothetical protein
MNFNYIHVIIVLLTILFLELIVERKYYIRRKIVNKLGVAYTLLSLLGVIVVIGLLTNWISPVFYKSDLFLLIRIGIIVFFIPKKGDEKK